MQIAQQNQNTPLGLAAVARIKELMQMKNAMEVTQRAQQSPDPMDQGLGALEANSVPEQMAEGGIVPRYADGEFVKMMSAREAGIPVASEADVEPTSQAAKDRAALAALLSGAGDAVGAGVDALLVPARAARNAGGRGLNALRGRDEYAPVSLTPTLDARQSASKPAPYAEIPAQKRGADGYVPPANAVAKTPAKPGTSGPAQKMGIADLAENDRNPAERSAATASAAPSNTPVELLKAAPTQSYLETIRAMRKELGEDASDKELKAAYAKQDAATDKAIAALEDDPKFLGISKRTLRAALASIGASQGTFLQAVGGSGAAVQVSKKDHEAKLQGLKDKKEKAGIAGIERRVAADDKMWGLAEKAAQHKWQTETAAAAEASAERKWQDQLKHNAAALAQADRLAREAHIARSGDIDRQIVGNKQVAGIRAGGGGGKPLTEAQKVQFLTKVTTGVRTDPIWASKPEAAIQKEIAARFNKGIQTATLAGAPPPSLGAQAEADFE